MAPSIDNSKTSEAQLPAVKVVPKTAAKPRFAPAFDPWNSSSTGHQRADNTPGTGWRDSRNGKLNSQFRASNTGGARLADTWGAGSEDWDDERKVLVPKSFKERKTHGRTVVDLLTKPGKMIDDGKLEGDDERKSEDVMMNKRKLEDEERETDAGGKRRGIFEGVVVYVNGSTYPLISDHKLKHLLSEHGGTLSLHLGRRKVTHVIVGRPVGSATRGGAAGGLAAGKIQKEIKRIGGCGVKFVGAEWVLESIKAGKRLPEARFANMSVAPKGQESVHTLYAKKES